MSTENILLLVVGGILLISVIIGYARGLLKTLIGMSSVLISLVLVFLFSGKVTDFLTEKTSVRETVYHKVEELVTDRVAAGEEVPGAEEPNPLNRKEVSGGLLAGLLNGLTGKGQDKETEDPGDAAEAEDPADSFLNDLASVLAEKKDSVLSQYIEKTSTQITDKIMDVLGVLVTFFLSLIVILILMLVTGVISRIPGVRTVNRLGGGILGLVRGLILVWLLFLVITCLGQTEAGMKQMEAIQNSFFLRLFYDGNLSFTGLVSKGLQLFGS